MTVSYQKDVLTLGFGNFGNALLRWRGSIYQMLIRHFLMYVLLYAIISLCYYFLLPEFPDAKFGFEKFCIACQNQTRYIPLTFLLGFYVSQVMSRWWLQFTTISWPDKIAIKMAAFCPQEEARDLKRTVIRQLNTCSLYIMRRISKKIQKRFPDLDAFVQAGYMTSDEKEILEKVEHSFNGKHSMHWFPVQWALANVRRLYDMKMFPGEGSYRALTEDIMRFAGQNGMSNLIAWVNIPLAYTQVVTIAVEAYFILILFGRQVLAPDEENWKALKWDPHSQGAWYTVIIAMFQFFFYMGWLKVAESMFNPFGGDTDDFEVEYMIDRNLEVSLFQVDFAHLPQQKDPLSDSFPMGTFDDKLRLLGNDPNEKSDLPEVQVRDRSWRSGKNQNETSFNTDTARRAYFTQPGYD